MAISVAEVYRLAVDELRKQCVERGIDSSGPVRVLRRRLVDHIRSNQMDEVGQQPPIDQARVPTDLESNGVENVSPIRVYCSHDGSGDGPVRVLIELLRQVSPGRSEKPEDIMYLFVRLGEIYDLKLVGDRVFMLRIMPLLTGSLLKFLGDCLQEGNTSAECKSRLLENYFPGFVKERLIRDLIVCNLQKEGQSVRVYINKIFQATKFLCYGATEQQLVDQVVTNLHPWILGQATLLDRPHSLTELLQLVAVIEEQCAVAQERQQVAHGPPVEGSAGVGPGVNSRVESRRQGRFAGASMKCWGCGRLGHFRRNCFSNRPSLQKGQVPRRPRQAPRPKVLSCLNKIAAVPKLRPCG